MANCILLTGGVDSPFIQRNLGAYRIASALNSAGYTTFVIDFSIDLTPDEICQALAPHLDSNTLWAGFSSTFFWANNSADDPENRLDKMYYSPYSEVKIVMDYIKANSNAKLVYGGAKSAFFNTDPNIDYYVLGYADVSVLALTDYLAGKSTTKPSRFIDSAKFAEPTMDAISTRWQDFTVIKNEALPLELARGCIFKCKFCSFPLIGKKKGTYLRDPSRIRDELIEAWEAHGTTNYYITDDTFNDDNDKIEALHNVFTNLPFKIQFTSYLRIDLLNKYTHQADLLTEMGLIGTFFGLETMQAESAKAIGKGLHPNKVKDRLYWLAERWKNKVNISSGFILGLPYDDVFYFDELVDWCLEKDNPLQQIEFYPLYLFNYTDPGMTKPYLSEFSINPEIYGYKFPGYANYSHWKLPEQNLSFDFCERISVEYNKLVYPRNKFGAFSILSAMNIGITLDDIYALTEAEIRKKYNVHQMKQEKLAEYKQLLGIGQLINTKNISKDY